MVFAYGEELVAYCLDAVFESAELRGRRMACIVTMIVSREQAGKKGNGDGYTADGVNLWLSVDGRDAGSYARSLFGIVSLADNLKLLFEARAGKGSLAPGFTLEPCY